MAVLLTACVPGDSGVTYSFVNRCELPIVVELASGSDPVSLRVGESGRFRSLDESPDEMFVVSRPDGTGEMRFAPGAALFEIAGARCPI